MALLGAVPGKGRQYERQKAPTVLAAEKGYRALFAGEKRGLNLRDPRFSGLPIK
jgi:hypothetical protein